MKIVSDADNLIDKNTNVRNIRHSLHSRNSEQIKKLQPNNRELNCMDFKTGVQSIHKEVLRLISYDSQPPDETITTLNDEKWKLEHNRLTSGELLSNDRRGVGFVST